MTKIKKPEVEKATKVISKYVEDTISYLRSKAPSTKASEEATILESEINEIFKVMPPREQAHMLFFAIMIFTKLARLDSREGKVFSNPVLIAQTLTSVMNAAVSKMGIDIIDVAFSVESDPTYTLKDGDVEKILTELKSMNLDILDPQGNA
jgi:uncharacterized protein YqgV (UPF0045/DUF77 family)